MNKQQSSHISIESLFHYQAKDYLSHHMNEIILGSVETMLGQYDVDNKTIYGLKTVLDELCNNASEHGSEPSSFVQCKIGIKNNVFYITIEDPGDGKPELTPRQLRNFIIHKNKDILKHEGKRGRGLTFIVNKLADSLHITKSSKGGIKISFTKNLFSS